jgi:hypothetical protein
MLRVQTRDKLFYSHSLPGFFTAHLFVFPMLTPMLTLWRGVGNALGKIKSPLQ